MARTPKQADRCQAMIRRRVDGPPVGVIAYVQCRGWRWKAGGKLVCWSHSFFKS